MVGYNYNIQISDSLDYLKSLPDNSVHCCVTSPPYYGLRDYGHDGQIGLEPTPDTYIKRLVEVFREVKRVLRDDGTLWLNLGDSYAAGGGFAPDAPSNKARLRGESVGALHGASADSYLARANGPRKAPPGFKPKDLIGIPWRVAFALQSDGWYLRQDIIWHKPNPMPESVRDRCTKAHEYVFLLAKSERYYYDAESIKEPAITAGQGVKTADGWDTGNGSHGSFHREGREKGIKTGSIQSETRNKRSVWTIVSEPYKGSHYAVMPNALVEPCIKAGTSVMGCCPKCGSPARRILEKTRLPTRPGLDTKTTGDSMVDGNRDPQRHITSTITLGWEASCRCRVDIKEFVPCTVIDPFMGSGTVAEVALGIGRKVIGCDIDERNEKLITKRIEDTLGIFASI